LKPDGASNLWPSLFAIILEIQNRQEKQKRCVNVFVISDGDWPNAEQIFEVNTFFSLSSLNSLIFDCFFFKKT
jgi:hypothetical protein